MQQLEVGGAYIDGQAPMRFVLPAGATGYRNAQIDDYGGAEKQGFVNRPKTNLSLSARFSHSAGQLVGTAGFGFWNAPLGDPTVRRPALPSATWFFFASEPNRLPFLGGQTGWFAATIDVRWLVAFGLLPLIVPVTIGNWFRPIHNNIWPPIERLLGIHAAPLFTAMDEWHDYHIEWLANGCRFRVDDATVLESPASPARPLGFVCWIDNQFMIATPQGKFGAGTMSSKHEQWMEIRDIALT